MTLALLFLLTALACARAAAGRVYRRVAVALVYCLAIDAIDLLAPVFGAPLPDAGRAVLYAAWPAALAFAAGADALAGVVLSAACLVGAFYPFPRAAYLWTMRLPRLATVVAAGTMLAGVLRELVRRAPSRQGMTSWIGALARLPRPAIVVALLAAEQLTSLVAVWNDPRPAWPAASVVTVVTYVAAIFVLALRDHRSSSGRQALG